MLLKSYTLKIFRPECNPHFQSLHCYAYLDQDISAVLPYLNAVLGGTAYSQDPPSLMLQVHGQLIGLHAKKIAINALKSKNDAEKIVAWLQNEINETWKNREKIVPCYSKQESPLLIEILKLLPRTNCKKCGQPTCTVFASIVQQGAKSIDDCLELESSKREILQQYLAQFSFAENDGA